MAGVKNYDGISDFRSTKKGRSVSDRVHTFVGAHLLAVHNVGNIMWSPHDVRFSGTVVPKVPRYGYHHAK